MLMGCYGDVMTQYKVTVTMPDGSQPDLPLMSRPELAGYLTTIKATIAERMDNPLPDSGTTHATYESHDDTTISWSIVDGD